MPPGETAPPPGVRILDSWLNNTLPIFSATRTYPFHTGKSRFSPKKKKKKIGPNPQLTKTTEYVNQPLHIRSTQQFTLVYQSLDGINIQLSKITPNHQLIVSKITDHDLTNDVPLSIIT